MCGTVSDKELCRICADPRRDRSIICVVEEPRTCKPSSAPVNSRAGTTFSVEPFDPLNGVGPDQLRIRELLMRVGNQDDGVDVAEVIVATDPNTEGEATATYLVRMMRDFPGLSVTRLASGLPMGGDHRVRGRAHAGTCAYGSSAAVGRYFQWHG